MENNERKPYEQSPEERTEYFVKSFEEMADEIYQANAAKVCLVELEKNPSLLTQEQRERLLRACDTGMRVNPNGCKEYRQFMEFKERLETLFTEK